MNDLYIEKTKFTPRVNFNAIKHELIIEGRSQPENVIEFYHPVIKWLEQYLAKSKGPIKVIYRLDYFNTASAKIIVEILMKFSRIKENGVKLNVQWYYNEYDDEMKDAIIMMSELTRVEIEILVNKS